MGYCAVQGQDDCATANNQSQASGNGCRAADEAMIFGARDSLESTPE